MGLENDSGNLTNVTSANGPLSSKSVGVLAIGRVI
jgi:hypothetical protein